MIVMRDYRSALASAGDARLPTRFWTKIVVEPSTGCWRWTGDINNKGYGRYHVGVDQPRQVPHRASYQALVGPIPAGLTIDHLCRNRACCNPAHLEPVTNRENILRGEGIAARRARATHCEAGHEWTPENTRISTTGHRVCRACKRKHEAVARARRRV
jgi:hypothetical protein